MQGKTLLIDGDLVEQDVQSVVDQFRFQPLSPGDTLHVYLNSPGGLTAVGYNIYHFLRWLNGKGVTIKTEVPSGYLCASACVMVFNAGDERIAGAASTFVLHAPWFSKGTVNPDKEGANKVYYETLRQADQQFYELTVKNRWIEEGETSFQGLELAHMAPNYIKIQDEASTIALAQPQGTSVSPGN